MAPLFADCDLVLVEGDSQTAAPKIEVWRAQLGTTPIASGDNSILAVVSDDPCPAHVPTLRRSDIAEVSIWVLNRLALAAN
jgi:molybdopterin-guanine dinucleotide biosynthesis protein